MKGFEYGVDGDTGDVYQETPDGEYVQWLPGTERDMIALTADIGDALDFVIWIRNSYGLPPGSDTGVVILKAKKPQFMPAADAIEFTKSSMDYVDFFQIDSFQFSVAWASPDKMEDVAPQFGGHGEISITGADLLHSKILRESLQQSGTPSIRSNIEDILSRVTQTQLA